MTFFYCNTNILHQITNILFICLTESKCDAYNPKCLSGWGVTQFKRSYFRGLCLEGLGENLLNLW